MSTEQAAGTRTEALLALADQHAAHNYHPLPVVIAEAEGAWVTDVEGVRYLDMLAAYSALNFGHRHPRLVEAAHASSTDSRSRPAPSTTTPSRCSAATSRRWPARTWCSR